MLFVGFAAVVVGAGVGFAFISKTGLTADCEVGAAGAGAAGLAAAATGAAGEVERTATVWLTVRAGAAGRVVAVRAVRAVVRDAFETALAGAAVSVVVSDVVAVVSGAAGGEAVVVAGSVVTTGGGLTVTGCASWALAPVEESAKAAAIAGRALVRA